MNKATQVLNLIETSIQDYLKGVGLGSKECYWVDQLQGQDTQVALVIYFARDHGGAEYSVQDILTPALITSVAKYIKPTVVTQIKNGEIQFQPISDKPIESARVLVVDSEGVIQFWGDFVK